MKHFNYQSCTVEELAAHVEVISPAVISTMRTYYLNKGNDGMVEKLDNARKIVKRKRLLARLEAM